MAKAGSRGGSPGPWEDGAIPLSERKEARSRSLAVLMLTVSAPPNAVLWRRWVQGASTRVHVYVNGKTDFKLPGSGRELSRLPPEVEVRQTAWGDHTLVLAHQALLRHALAEMPQAQWFALVSGDSLPLMGARAMLQRLAKECGMSASQMGRYTERECLQQYTAMSEALQLWHALPERARAPNWWHDAYAEAGEDDEGSYRAFAEEVANPRGIHGHSQFIVLSREHAQAVADMPPEVARDYDTLMAPLGSQQKLAADEVAVGHYLLYLQHEGLVGGRFLDEDVMHAPLDSKDKAHARLHSKLPIGLLSQDKFLFGRKYQAFDLASTATLLRAWGTKNPEVIAAKLLRPQMRWAAATGGAQESKARMGERSGPAAAAGQGPSPSALVEGASAALTAAMADAFTVVVGQSSTMAPKAKAKGAPAAKKSAAAAKRAAAPKEATGNAPLCLPSARLCPPSAIASPNSSPSRRSASVSSASCAVVLSRQTSVASSSSDDEEVPPKHAKRMSGVSVSAAGQAASVFRMPGEAQVQSQPA
jgi:hypothetical protein